MKPPAFDYVRPTSVDEATAALAQHGDAAKLIAGGQSLVPMLNFRLLAPAVLVDLNGLPGLDTVEVNGDSLRIGSLTRHRTLETSSEVAARFPVVTAAMAHVAHLAIRNRGTIGGSLSHADPAAELPTLALLLDARIGVAGPDGTREIAAADFFEGALTTALADDEMVTHADIPNLPAGHGWGFQEIARRHGDFGLAGAAAVVTRNGDTAGEVRIAMLGVGDTPLRATAAEDILTGSTFDAGIINAAIEAVRSAVEPNDDLHASADFRRHLAGVQAKRALADAWARATKATA